MSIIFFDLFIYLFFGGAQVSEGQRERGRKRETEVELTLKRGLRLLEAGLIFT